MSSQIHDLGYRSYEGERAGVPWAVRSLALHSVRRALGLKRAGQHKIVPVITILFAFAPAIVLAAIAAFIGNEILGDLISYGDYFGTISFALFLFTAASAPGVLTTDRTSGMLAMYLASPLSRSTYVLAKAIGLFAVMLIVTVGPIVFLILAFTLAGSGPGGILDFFETMARALVAGILAAAFFTSVGMFISSIPRRWGIASVVIVAAFFIPNVVAAALTEGAGVSDWFALLSPPNMVGKSWQHILGDPSSNDLAIDRLPATAVILSAIGYTLAFSIATWWRYQTIEVER